MTLLQSTEWKGDVGGLSNGSIKSSAMHEVFLSTELWLCCSNRDANNSLGIASHLFLAGGSSAASRIRHPSVVSSIGSLDHVLQLQNYCGVALIQVNSFLITLFIFFKCMSSTQMCLGA